MNVCHTQWSSVLGIMYRPLWCTLIYRYSPLYDSLLNNISLLPSFVFTLLPAKIMLCFYYRQNVHSLTPQASIAVFVWTCQYVSMYILWADLFLLLLSLPLLLLYFCHLYFSHYVFLHYFVWVCGINHGISQSLASLFADSQALYSKTFLLNWSHFIVFAVIPTLGLSFRTTCVLINCEQTTTASWRDRYLRV